jgi:hypothetical protein
MCLVVVFGTDLCLDIVIEFSAKDDSILFRSKERQLELVAVKTAVIDRLMCAVLQCEAVRNLQEKDPFFCKWSPLSVKPSGVRYMCLWGEVSMGACGKQTKEAAKPTSETRDPRIPSQLELPTRNLFAPLKTADMELKSAEETKTQPDGDQQQPPSSQRGRPPPIMPTSETNLIQLQKQLKGLVKASFEFQNTRTGTRVVTKEMADCSAIKQYLNFQKLHYFTFFPKSLKLIKAGVRHLTGNTPAEEIYEGVVELGFDIVSVKCPPPVGHKT